MVSGLERKRFSQRCRPIAEGWEGSVLSSGSGVAIIHRRRGSRRFYSCSQENRAEASENPYPAFALTDSNQPINPVLSVLTKAISSILTAILLIDTAATRDSVPNRCP